MKKYYETKLAVVTGGASGIGLALCEMLLSFGAKAVIMSDVNSDNLTNQSARLDSAYPGKMLGIQADVTEREEVAELIRRAAEFGAGRIDFLFNNAGLSLAKSFDEATYADWKFAFDVNFYGALHGIKAVLPIMRAQGGGHIANTASGIGFIPMAYQSMYSASKSALIGLTGSLRYELWDENIRFSTIIPGTVDTPMWEGKAPDTAITPEQSARGILKGVAANERIVIVTEPDRIGAANAFRPETAKEMDEYLLNVARKRQKLQQADMKTVMSCITEQELKRSTQALLLANIPFETRKLDDNGIELTELQVSDDIFDNACDVIETFEDTIFDDQDRPREKCPQCGSTDLERRDDFDCKKSITGISWIAQCRDCGRLIPHH